MRVPGQALSGAALLMMLACGGSDDRGPLRELGVAACKDRRAGLSFFQIAQGGLKSGLDRKEIASSILLGIEDECPEFKDEFQETLIYQEWLD